MDEKPDCDKVVVANADGDCCCCDFDPAGEDSSRFGKWAGRYDPVTLGYVDADWCPIDESIFTHWMPENEFMRLLPQREGEIL